MLLAIDTATKNSSIALYDESGVRAEINWSPHQNHTVELMPQVLRALKLARVERQDLVALGVALGPGSFSGLRSGMSVAKGLAYALSVPLLGVPTLDSIAAVHSLSMHPIYAVVTSGRGRYTIALFQARDGMSVRVGEYVLVDAQGLVECVRTAALTKDSPQSQILVCGEIDNALADKLREKLGTRHAIASHASNTRRAGFLAELAWARFMRGESDDVESLAPMYST